MESVVSVCNLRSVNFYFTDVSEPSLVIIFGLMRSKFEEVKEAIELQELFGFDELQSEIAFYLHQTYGYPLKDTFRFVDEYSYEETQKRLGDDADEDRLSRVEYYNSIVKADADDPEMRYAYFDVGITSIYVIYHLIDKLHNISDNDITQLEPKLIEMCAYEDFDARFCKRAVAYYLENATEIYGKDAFEEYVEYLLEGQYIENAFENISQTEGWDDLPIMSEEAYKYEIEECDWDDPFEKWAAEETDYSEKDWQF